MIELFRRYTVYYSLAFSLVLLGLVMLLVYSKGELVLFFEHNSTPAMDTFFYWVTKGGEIYMGILTLILTIVFGSKRFVIVFILSILLSLIVSQGLKHKVFPLEDRPYSEYKDLRDIDGLERHVKNSFPSGHTTAAFTFFTLLALSLRKRWIQILAPICASLVGVSRVYLGQHYLNDIVAGAVLGIFIVSIVTLLFHKKYPVLE